MVRRVGCTALRPHLSVSAGRITNGTSQTCHYGSSSGDRPGRYRLVVEQPVATPNRRGDGLLA
jgi:hypothetical protein